MTGEILIKQNKKQEIYYKKAIKLLKKHKCVIKEIIIDKDIIIKYEA